MSPKGKGGGPARVVELFAGVGGFRLGLERSGWKVVFSNQWEPSTKAQHASDCYVHHFGPEGHTNDDIAAVLDDFEAGQVDIPDHELVVGGFPCQDYSVAKVLNQAKGLRGKKGVLWWEIERLLRHKRPPMLFLENVDRLLKSPATQRGRDFAIMLASLNDLGYVVEWRVVNAADYGFPQRRRRVFLTGYRSETINPPANPVVWLTKEGPLARALPVEIEELGLVDDFTPDLEIRGDLTQVTRNFGRRLPRSPFLSGGIAIERMVWTRGLTPRYGGPCRALRDVLQPDDEIGESFFIPAEQLDRWRYLKGSKKELRTHRESGFSYHYNEGPVAFPEPLDQPSRTILTGEGGSSPSRFKHAVETQEGRIRRLTPIELERLNGFEDDWTNTGMPDGRRAFMMGNALVVGAVESVGRELFAMLQC